MSTALLQLEQLACGYGHRTVLRDISFRLDAGELLCLLGPNGVGKTTLFKTILGLLPAQHGAVLVDGKAAASWSRREFARWIGYVPQAHTPPFPFAVADVVAMGRVAHLGAFASPRTADRDIAAAALASLSIEYLADARYTEISGGERQLVLIARALAQQPRVLVMDEPTSNLDYGNQLKLMAHVRRIAEHSAMGVILTTHHPNQALLYASQALVLDRDNRYAIGLPAEVITESYLQHTYGVAAEIHHVTHRDGQVSRFCLPCPQTAA